MPAQIKVVEIGKTSEGVDFVVIDIFIDDSPALPPRTTLKVGETLNITLLAEQILEKVMRGVKGFA